MKIRLSLIAAAVAAGLFSSPAAAQDAAAPAWAGVYIGAHLEGLLGRFSTDTTFQRTTFPVPGINPGSTATASFGSPEWLAQGVGGGISAGYNAQKNRVVFGVEGDFSLTRLTGRADNDISAAALIGANLAAITTPVDGYDGVQQVGVNWISSFRGRLGFTAGRVLLFGTGGVAVAGVTTTTDYFALQGNDVVLVSTSNSGVRVGWTGGAGAEVAVTPRLSVKAEYLFSDFGSFPGTSGNYITTGGVEQTVATQNRLAVHAFRLGMNLGL